MGIFFVWGSINTKRAKSHFQSLPTSCTKSKQVALNLAFEAVLVFGVQRAFFVWEDIFRMGGFVWEDISHMGGIFCKEEVFLARKGCPLAGK